MKLLIDASNVGLGGGVTHLRELLESLNGIQHSYKIILVAQKRVLDVIPEFDFLDKQGFKLLEKTIFHRVYFQLFKYDFIIPEGYLVFSVTGDFLGNYKPVVGMARNMLLYERDQWKPMVFKQKIRFFLNFLKQKRSFINSIGLIFISKYSRELVVNSIPQIRGTDNTIIYHGVKSKFKFEVQKQKPIQNYTSENPYIISYISTIHTYKNHINLIKAINEVYLQGYPIQLHLFGKILDKKTGDQVLELICELDRTNTHLIYHGHVEYDVIEKYYLESDALIYASSCETMPNILIESMMSGRPIISSNKGPMFEFAKEYAFYFNPYNVFDIKENLISFLNNPIERERKAILAQIEAGKYSWNKTTIETMSFLDKKYKEYFV